MTDHPSTRGVTTLWIVLLTLASLATSSVLACMVPLAALAALAATHMRQRDALLVVVACWAANQAVGFGLKGYPHDATTIMWGAAIGIAAVAAVAAARLAAGTIAARPLVARTALGFLAGFVAFKLVLLIASLGLGGTDIATSVPIISRQVVRESAILAGLFALYHGLVAIGLPAAPAPRRLATA